MDYKCYDSTADGFQRGNAIELKAATSHINHAYRARTSFTANRQKRNREKVKERSEREGAKYFLKKKDGIQAERNRKEIKSV